MNSQIQFTLGSTLNELNISRYRLATEAKVRPTTVNDMVANSSTRVNLATLTDILDALNTIAEERKLRREFDIEDVFVYIRK